MALKIMMTRTTAGGYKNPPARFPVQRADVLPTRASCGRFSCLPSSLTILPFIH
ncbi:hypothetical protein HMPREF9080_01201 [Cardiobacterium valvarum F0432]|uniref:Uncharacterized protein n=1 Tax=Cardiobacterium valvarum F0432 TaxID=797473 RepID=G9ZEM1_9GAMM|nr:hypothetical protein HMPREF9080_01201 [Cardiobacterium valvarum F0432]